MVNAEQVHRGVARFLDENLLPQFPEGSVEKVLLGAGAAIFLRRNLPKIMTALGDGQEVDEGMLLEEVRSRIPESGMRIENLPFLKSITIYRKDADELIRCVREA